MQTAAHILKRSSALEYIRHEMAGAHLVCNGWVYFHVCPKGYALLPSTKSIGTPSVARVKRRQQSPRGELLAIHFQKSKGEAHLLHKQQNEIFLAEKFVKIVGRMLQ